MKQLTVVTLLLTFATLSTARQRRVEVFADQAAAPFVLEIGANGKPVDGMVDYRDHYRSLGITALRTHDWYGPGDWQRMFDWSKEADDPDAYDFTATDELLGAAIEAGFDILFRIGPSWRGSSPFPSNDPPGTIRDGDAVVHEADSTDFVKFAEVARHFVMHYNDEWKDGHRWNIKRWEIWNEPDLRDQFWDGSPEQFHQMFATVAKTLKAYDETLMVGGPGLVDSPKAAFTEGLMQYLEDTGSPLDFLSWHSYGGSTLHPWTYTEHARTYQELLDRHGYSGTVQYCDEWNAGPGQINTADSGAGAAYFGGALSYLEDAGVAGSYVYRADGHALGLIDPASGEVRRAALVLPAWQRMIQAGHRVRATGGDSTSVTVVASASTDRRRAVVLLSNFGGTDETIDLRIPGLAVGPGDVLSVVRHEISDAAAYAVVDSTVVAPGLLASFLLLSESVQTASVEVIQGASTAAGDPADLPESIAIRSIFPNPATDRVAIGFDVRVAGTIRLEVFDLLGRRVAEWTADAPAGHRNVSADVSGLPAGLYAIRVADGGSAGVSTLIIR